MLQLGIVIVSPSLRNVVVLPFPPCLRKTNLPGRFSAGQSWHMYYADLERENARNARLSILMVWDARSATFVLADSRMINCVDAKN